MKYAADESLSRRNMSVKESPDTRKEQCWYGKQKQVKYFLPRFPEPVNKNLLKFALLQTETRAATPHLEADTVIRYKQCLGLWQHHRSQCQ